MIKKVILATAAIAGLCAVGVVLLRPEADGLQFSGLLERFGPTGFISLMWR